MIETLAEELWLVMADHGGVMTAKGEQGTNEKKTAQCLGLESIEVGDLNELLKRGRSATQSTLLGSGSAIPAHPSLMN